MQKECSAEKKEKKTTRKVANMILYIFLTIGAAGFLVYYFNPAFGSRNNEGKLRELQKSNNFKDGKFQNLVETNMSMSRSDRNFFELLREFYFSDKLKRSPQEPLPNLSLDKEIYQKEEIDDFLVTWLGHSILLIKSGDKTIIVDPVFSKRSSPFEFLGPKRFPYEREYELTDLPKIDIVLISHDHYDHLDYKSIIELKDRVEKFYVPLGVGAHLLKWGVAENKITEFDWYEKSSFGELGFVFTPTRHFSGRGLNDRMATLWGGWIIQNNEKRIYLGADSAYFKEFKKIGEEFGPFEIAFIESGAYNKNWPDVHMFPEETVQTAIDLKAKILMPIHNSKFDLSLHPWKEPLERVSEEASRRELMLASPMIGESFFSNLEIPQKHWWVDLE